MLWALENCGGHFSGEPETRIGRISVRNVRFCSGHIYTNAAGSPPGRTASPNRKKETKYLMLCCAVQSLSPLLCSPRLPVCVCASLWASARTERALLEVVHVAFD